MDRSLTTNSEYSVFCESIFQTRSPQINGNGAVFSACWAGAGVLGAKAVELAAEVLDVRTLVGAFVTGTGAPETLLESMVFNISTVLDAPRPPISFG